MADATNNGLAWLSEQRSPTADEAAAMVRAASRPANLPAVGLAVGLTAAWIASYWNTFSVLVQRWSGDPNYSHGFVVPLVSLYLLWQQPLPVGDRPRGGWFVGAAAVVAGVALRWITLLLPSLLLECTSMLLMLGGLVILLGGWAWWRRAWPALSFLVFMIPWPRALYSRVAFPLQLFVSHVASVLLQLAGIPVLQDGNLIHLPAETMHVAEACSGLRQLTAFLAICTCAALLMRRPMWYRTFVLASAVPIAVVINVVRVTGTGLVIQFGDKAWTEGLLHTAEGLVMVGLGLGLLMLELKLLDWLLEDEDAATPKGTASAWTGGAPSPG
ncbi:MAG: exosortase/archaeosortase family protein [Planctomycetia bacterium]